MSSELFLVFENVIQVGWAEGRTSGLYPIRGSRVTEKVWTVSSERVSCEDGLPCLFRKGKLQ